MAEAKLLYPNQLGGWAMEVDGAPVATVGADLYEAERALNREMLEAAKDLLDVDSADNRRNLRNAIIAAEAREKGDEAR